MPADPHSGPKDPEARARWDSIIAAYKAGKSQKDLCQELGLSSGTLSRIVNSDPEVRAAQTAARAERERLVALLVEMREQGKSREEMAQVAGVTKHRIGHLLQTTPTGRATLQRFSEDVASRRKAIEDLYRQGFTAIEIAELLDLSYSRISHIVRDLDIKGKDPSPEARKVFESSLTHIETLTGLGRIPIPLDLTDAEVANALAVIVKAQEALRHHNKRLKVAYNIKTDNRRKKDTGSEYHHD